MSSPRHRIATSTAAVGAISVALILGTSTNAFAAGPDAVTNGSFNAPGVEGATPAGWTATSYDNEIKPYSANIGTYDAAGQYAAPAGTPGGDTVGNFASEDFYEAGGATGIEGYGGSQTLTTPLAGTSAPQASWSTVQSFAPAPSVASWAGSMVELDLTSAGGTYRLRYINPFTPANATYSASPTASDTATTKYVVLTPLTAKAWYTQAPRDVAADALTQFSLTTFSVAGVRYGNIELATSSASPYPNMTSYWKNLSLTSTAAATPPPALPESPLALGLPLVGLLGAGGMIWFRRRATPAARG